MMTRLTIRQVRSAVGCKQYQRDTLRTLGLKRVGDSSTREDRPEVRGMIKTVAHLVAVEEVD
jgi:large subunit ribosomal protein L30